MDNTDKKTIDRMLARREIDDDTAGHQDNDFQWLINNHEKVEDHLNQQVQSQSHSSLSSASKSAESLQIEEECSHCSSEQNSISQSENTNYHLTENIAKIKSSDIPITMENIELDSLKQENELNQLDIDLIERDAALQNGFSLITPKRKNICEGRPAGFCYTPERLIRNLDYRILTPSPRDFLGRQSPQSPKENLDIPANQSPRKSSIMREKMETLINSSQPGAQHLGALLDRKAPDISVPISIRRRRYLKNRFVRIQNFESDNPEDVLKDPLEIANRGTLTRVETPDLASSDSHSSTRSSPLSPTNNSAESLTPVSLSDELANASRIYNSRESQQNKLIINDVVSILEDLDTNPDQAEYLIEDRFRSCFPGHDRLTRLVLSIEQEDQPEATIRGGSTEDIFNQLRGKVEKLQVGTKDIYKEIEVLKKDFQFEDRKVTLLETETSALRQEIVELRYLDDLLNLLRGELVRISRRNWPFVLGHSDIHNEEVNLVV